MTAEQGKANLSNVLKLVVKHFLEPGHFRSLQRVLGPRWADSKLSAAIRLMEANGLKLKPEELEELAVSPEEKIIEALVARMPQQSSSFEHFFLQLSFIVSTASRLRAAIEAGQAELVEEVLESAENVGVLSYVIKSAVYHASLEVADHERKYEVQRTEMEEKLAPLLQSQVMAMVNQRALKAAQLRLSGQYSRAKEEICAAVTKLESCRKERLNIVRKMLIRNSEATNRALLATVFASLLEEAAAGRKRKSSARSLQGLAESSKHFMEIAAVKALSGVTALIASDDCALKAFVIDAFLLLVSDSKKESAMSRNIEEAHRRTRSLVDISKACTKRVLTSLADVLQGDIVKAIVGSWAQVVNITKWHLQLDEHHTAIQQVARGFVERNKTSATVHNEGHAAVFLFECLVVIFSHWKRDMLLERVHHWGRQTNERRKQELSGVKGLFKSFAAELETSISAGTPRVLPQPTSNNQGSSLVSKVAT